MVCWGIAGGGFFDIAAFGSRDVCEQAMRFNRIRLAEREVTIRGVFVATFNQQP